MPSRTEATRAKAALCATGRLTPLRLFSTLPVCSPVSLGFERNGIFQQLRQPPARSSNNRGVIPVTDMTC
jgi:hypothetical protein